MEKEYSEITGNVEHVVFHKEETGFTVLELGAGDELVTVVGEMAAVGEGEELVCTGFYVNHPQFGSQFKAASIERKLPTSSGAIYKYLASGAIKGIGASTARNILDRFGTEALTVIENEPERLAEVKGVSAKKAAEIGREFQRVYGIRTVMAFLGEYRLRTEHIIAAWKKWGPMTSDVVKADPFALCDPEVGVAFEDADTIRARLGLEEDAPCRVRAGVLYVLRHNAGNGHTCLPKGKLAEIAARALNLGTECVAEAVETLCGDGSLRPYQTDGRETAALPEYHDAEAFIARRLGVWRVMKSVGHEDYESRIAALEMEKGITYAAAQRQAIELAMNESALVLTGGPGTGKTTTLNAIIALFRQRGLKVSLCAPTGRAAKRMSELTGSAAQTIHRLLEVSYESEDRMTFVHDEKNTLPCDAVVIDEMSMVDAQLFESLLRALRLNCKLVLVGDSDQLPSVGAGNVLGDIIASGVFPVVELREIFRQAAESLIVTNAHRIIEGRQPELTRRDGDFFFLGTGYPGKTAQTVCDLVGERLPRSYGYSPTWDIQVLCPSRQGEIGTVQLNARLQALLNPPDGLKRELVSYGTTFREGDKVMQTRNNYDIVWHKGEEEGAGVFNGDIGVLAKIDKANGVVQVKFDDRLADYEAETASELEHAWAITVHKSQGSEFEAVVIPLQEWHPRLYYRKLLYTAVTRAKRLLILLGFPGTVGRMVESDRRDRRYTNLCAMLEREIAE